MVWPLIGPGSHWGEASGAGQDAAAGDGAEFGDSASAVVTPGTGPADVADGAKLGDSATATTTPGLVGPVSVTDGIKLGDSAVGTETVAPVFAGVAYRIRVYDTDGLTVLTPAAGAPHADPFRAASIAGVAGYVPYLDGASIRGRRAAIDVRERRSDKGQLALQLYDPRLDTTNNLQRWVSAFEGDALGKKRLKNLRIDVEESTDGAATWPRFFTGRIQRVRLVGRLRYELTLRDQAEELEWDVHYGLPHGSISYAHPAPLLPNGITRAYGNLPVIEKVRATWRTWSTVISGSGRYLEIDGAQPLATRGLLRLHDELKLTINSGELVALIGIRRIARTWRIRATEGDFHLAMFTNSIFSIGTWFGVNRDSDGRQVVTSLGLAQVDPADPNFTATSTIPDGTVTTFELVRDDEPSEGAPLLVNDVHPAQYIADLLDGKFGRLNPDGSVAWTVPRNAASFAPILTDGSFITARDYITEGARLGDVIDDVCRDHGLGYNFNKMGEFTLLDLRVPEGLPASQVLTNADLDPASPPEYTDDRTGAVAWTDVTFFGDRALAPEDADASVAAIRVVADELRQIDIVDTTLDVGSRPLRNTARTLRFTSRAEADADLDTYQDQPRRDVISAYLSRDALGYRDQFGRGPSVVALTALRTANVAVVELGGWVLLNADELPGPATHQRGESRLLRVIERHEDGPRVRLRLLDSGRNLQAAAPSLGALSLASGNERHTVQFTLTLNGSGHPAAVWHALTDTSVATRPADADPRWTFGQLRTTGGTVQVPDLPGGFRVWVRARSHPGVDGDIQIPSPWAYPTGSGFIDLTALPTPLNLATVVSQATITLTWTHPTDGLAFSVMPLLDERDDLAAPLPAGSTRYTFEGLQQATNYLVGVQYVSGGTRGPVVSVPATTGTLGTLDAPRGLTVLQGRASDDSLPPIDENSRGIGLEVGWRSAPPEVRVRVQLDTSASFPSPDVDKLRIAGATRVILETPLDDVERFVRIRSERAGWSSSPWSEIVSAKPTPILDQTPTFDTFAGGSAELVGLADGRIELRIVSADADTDAAYYEVSRDPVAQDFPEVTTADTRVERTSFPHTVDLGRLYAGEEVYATVRFANDAKGFGQSVHLYRLGDFAAAKNLINNPTESGTLEKWTAGAATIEQLPWGGLASADVLALFADAASGNRLATTDQFQVALGRAYEVSGYVQTTRDDGQVHVAINASDAAGAALPTTAFNKAARTSFVSSAGVLLNEPFPTEIVGDWYYFSFFVMPPETPDEVLWSLGTGNQYNLRYDAGVRLFNFQLRNFNNDATGKTLYAANLVVREVGEESVRRISLIATDQGALRDLVIQKDSVAGRRLTRGLQTGSARHGDAVTFAPSFQNVPIVQIAGGISYQPDATAWSGTFDSAAPQYEHSFAQDVSASGFTVNAELKQLIGVLTAQTDTFAGATLSAEGASEAVNLDPGAAHDDVYVVQYDLNALDQKTTGSSQVTVAVDTNDGVTGWIERSVKTYAQEGVGVNTKLNETQTINASGLGLNDDVRVRIKSFNVYAGTAVLDVSADEVRYTTSTGALSTASKTPEATDAIIWTAREES